LSGVVPFGKPPLVEWTHHGLTWFTFVLLWVSFQVLISGVLSWLPTRLPSKTSGFIRTFSTDDSVWRLTVWWGTEHLTQVWLAIHTLIRRAGLEVHEEHINFVLVASYTGHNVIVPAAILVYITPVWQAVCFKNTSFWPNLVWQLNFTLMCLTLHLHELKLTLILSTLHSL